LNFSFVRGARRQPNTPAQQIGQAFDLLKAYHFIAQIYSVTCAESSAKWWGYSPPYFRVFRNITYKMETIVMKTKEGLMGKL